MSYTPRYLHSVDHNPPKSRGGLRPRPENWHSEARVIERDIYYGLLKHRAQAKYRSEAHSLTCEQWNELWTVDRWLKRGRNKTDLCLMKIDPDLGWHKDNVEVVERIVYLERAKEYRGIVK